MGSMHRVSAQRSFFALPLGAVLVAAGFFGCKKSEAPSPSTGAATTAVASVAPSVEGSTGPERKTVPPPADVAEPPATAEKLEDGVVSVLLEPGTGKSNPKGVDRVKVHYTGWTRDGAMLVSTSVRERPHTLPMERLKDGWEGKVLSKMVVGEKRRFWVPPELARSGFSRRAKPDQAITFDIQLMEIVEVPEPPPVPPDVARAPADAKRTKSGLAYKVLQKGTGTVHPKPEQRVVVHYTGWTTDGKMFDSSIPRGTPSTFSLNQVIKGWTEGLQLMVEGEKTRFWIPADLAYGDTPSRPGAPSGLLVFDVELIRLN